MNNDKLKMLYIFLSNYVYNVAYKIFYKILRVFYFVTSY